MLVAILLKDIVSVQSEMAYQMAFDLAALDDAGLITALIPLLPADESFDKIRSILRGTITRQL